ncbi:hypothetical protein RQP46_005263 [Phenoliferia psychrophenolica]
MLFRATLFVAFATLVSQSSAAAIPFPATLPATGDSQIDGVNVQAYGQAVGDYHTVAAIAGVKRQAPAVAFPATLPLSGNAQVDGLIAQIYGQLIGDYYTLKGIGGSVGAGAAFPVTKRSPQAPAAAFPATLPKTGNAQVDGLIAQSRSQRNHTEY